MNKDKRNDLKILGLALCATSTILPNRWKTPIVNAVLLPAHAQTSVCIEGVIVGDWAFFFDDDSTSIVELAPNGSGASFGSPGSFYYGELKWDMAGDEITIYSVDDAGSDSGEIKYKANISQSCDKMNGSVESVTADYIGSFHAEHCPDDDCSYVI